MLRHLHMEDTINRQSVYKYERVLASCVVILARQWFEYNYGCISALNLHLSNGKWVLPEVQRFLSDEVIQITADATNTPAAQSSKAHVCQVQSLFGPPGAIDKISNKLVVQADDDGDVGIAGDASFDLLERHDFVSGALLPPSSFYKVYPDMRRIPDKGFGAVELRSMLIEQTRFGIFIGYR